jgi:multiple sugar transport system substrate-binding protein
MTRLMSILAAVCLTMSVALPARRAGAEEPVTVTWMVSVGPDKPMYEQMVQMFHEQQSKVRVQFFWVPGSQYQMKLKTLIAAGQAPDIFWSCDAWVPYEAPFLADLTPYVRRDAAELDLDDFYPELLKACRYDGRQILLPRLFNVSLLYYLPKLFDEAGVAYPSPDWTWNDYIRAGQKLTKRGPDGKVNTWGSGIAYGWWGEWLIYVRQSGGTLFSDDMNRCLLDTPEAVQGMQFYFDKVYKYGIAPAPGFGPDYGFISGKLAMDMGGHTGQWITYNQIEGLDWDIQVLPAGPITRDGGEFAIDTFGVNKASKHVPEAWEFVKFLVSKPSIRKHVENGFLSVRKSVAEEMLFTPKRTMRPHNIRAAYEQLKYSQILPRSPDYVEIALEVIQPDIDRMMDKRTDVAQTCRSAAQAANRFIEVLGATRREISDARP